MGGHELSNFGIVAAQKSAEAKDFGHYPFVVWFAEHEVHEISYAFVHRLHLLRCDAAYLALSIYFLSKSSCYLSCYLGY